MLRASAQFSGKWAYITGSSKGIGLAYAKALASHGWNVALNGRGPIQEHQKLSDELIRDYDVQSTYLQANMKNVWDVKESVHEVAKQFGSLDILIYNAGFPHFNMFEDITEEQWTDSLEVSLTAPFHAIQTALPYMKQNNWGRIILTSSIASKVATPGITAYTTVKHGMNGLAKSVAVETAQQGITCNAICPGYVKTSIAQSIVDRHVAKGGDAQEVEEKMVKKTLQKEWIDATALGDLAVFLCSESGRNTTGAELVVDAGYTLV